MVERTAGTLTISDAGPPDIPGIRALAECIWRSSYAAMLSTAQIDYMLGWMYGPDKIVAEMASGVLWRLAALDGMAAGFLSVTIHDADLAELNKLYLLPSLQGLGHGRMLLDEAIAMAAERGCATLQLRVNKTNARALRAYRRAGFVEIDALVADIGGGFVMDDYVLARMIAQGRSAAHPSHSSPQ